MKVYIDNNHCKDKDGICGSMFGGPIEMFFTGHPQMEDVRVAGCVTKVTDTEYEDRITFHICRASGDTRILYVSKGSWPQAYQTWMNLYLPQKARLNL